MNELLNRLAQLQNEARALIANADATPDEIQAKMDEIQAVKAKIDAQKALDEMDVVNNTPVNTPVVTSARDLAAEKPFNNFGEQMLAIVKACRPGGEIDSRLLAIQNAASGANEAIGADGGFLVQKDFATELLRNVYETGIIAPKCVKIPISANSNGVKINGVDEKSRADGSRWGGVRGYWADEAATVTATAPKFRKIELTLNKLMALYYSTDELLQDAAALEAVLIQAFREELQFKLDDAIIRGSGAGQPLGILNAGCLISISKENGQAADTIVHENISNLWTRCWAKSRANAVWLYNQECEPQLEAMTVAVGTGGEISPLAKEFSEKGTMKGRPCIPVEQAAALGDVGDIILADLSQYILADKDLQSASSMHVRFVYDEMAFRMTYRVDGQPIRSAAITPFKGNNTLSSFLALAAR